LKTNIHVKPCCYNLKVLVIGYGSIGKRHIDNLSSLVNVEIIICTHKKLDNFLRKRKCQVIRSLDKCIQENPEFAIIANESSLHLQIITTRFNMKISFQT